MTTALKLWVLESSPRKSLGMGCVSARSLITINSRNENDNHAAANAITIHDYSPGVMLPYTIHHPPRYLIDRQTPQLIEYRKPWPLAVADDCLIVPKPRHVAYQHLPVLLILLRV